MKEKPITFGGTMGKEILLLNEIRRDDVAEAGGKGGELGGVVPEGVPGPPRCIFGPRAPPSSSREPPKKKTTNGGGRKNAPPPYFPAR